MVHCRSAFCLLFVATLLFTGCASTPRLEDFSFPVEAELVEIDASQQEIETAGTNTLPGVAMAMGGGVLSIFVAAVIDEVIDSRNEKAVTDFREALASYPISERFAEKLQNSRIVPQLTTSGEVVIQNGGSEAEGTALNEDSFLLRPRVLFGVNLQTLIVRIDLDKVIREGREGKTPRQGNLLNAEFIWSVSGGQRLNRKDAAEMWAGMPQEEFIALVERGMDTTIRMVEARLQEPQMALDQRRPGARIPGFPLRLVHWRNDDDLNWYGHQARNRMVAVSPAVFGSK